MPGIATRAGSGGFDSVAGERALKSRFGLATLDGIGAPSRAELAAAGGLLAYLDSTQKGAGVLLDAPRRVARSAHMQIDAATRESLELTRSASGGVAGSLLGEIDRCVTACGRRLLAADLSAPLTDRAAIDARLQLVAWFFDDQLRRERTRAALKAMPDLARALARLTAGRGGPRDLAQLRDGLAAADCAARRARGRARPAAAARRAPAAARRPRRAGRPSSPRRWSTRRRSTRPRAATSREGYDAALDALRSASSDGRRAIAALEARYREATGVALAQDPPQCGARLSYRGRGAARRRR